MDQATSGRRSLAASHAAEVPGHGMLEARRCPREVERRLTVEPERFVGIQCPHCGERLETRVDLTAGEREYIEDCEVCCRPIELSIELEESGALRAVRVQRPD